MRNCSQVTYALVLLSQLTRELSKSFLAPFLTCQLTKPACIEVFYFHMFHARTPKVRE